MSYALHRLALRQHARRLARASANEFAAEGLVPADRAGSCHGSAPEGSSGASAARIGHKTSANAGLPRDPFTVPCAPIGAAHELADPPVGRTHDTVTTAPVPAKRSAAARKPKDHSGERAAAIETRGGGRSPVHGRIDLGQVMSVMDQRATVQAEAIEAAARAAIDVAGKAWCDRCDALVPEWFGDDCISGDCSLRAGGRKVA